MLYICLSRGNSLPFHPELTKVKIHVSFFLQFFFDLGSSGTKLQQLNRTSFYRLDEFIHRYIRMLRAMFVTTLVPYAFATLISTHAFVAPVPVPQRNLSKSQ
jgi:hypothetical protein